MARAKRLFATVILATSAALPSLARADVSLHQGRYLGWIQTAGGDARKIAATMDLFVVKPNDPAGFPTQQALLRLSLGGVQSAEYTTEIYDDLQYDFTNGILSMGGATNDVSATAKASTNDVGQSLLDGQVFIRSAALSGTLHLAELSDDPEADPGTVPADQYRPTLSGQYDGRCSGQDALLQLEVGRGIDPPAVSGDHRGLAAYALRGRIGFHDSEATCPAPLFCAMRNYTSGSYDLFRGRLLVNGGYPDECTATKDGFKCTVHYGSDTFQCDFKREPTLVQAPKFYQRTEFLQLPPAQMANLPDPNPPANTELVTALQGDWVGYLHHEANDHYQPMRMNVMAYSSTNNPHNENLVYVTGASVLYFGKGMSDEFFVQQFDPRSFYLVPGFTLESSAASDAFLQVDKWRQGYVHGVWYSHAFGRVGTFELVKGTTLPKLSARAKYIPSIAGAFIGPKGYGGDMEDGWWVNYIIPTQSARAELSTLEFLGQYQLMDGAIPRQAITKGNYDFYSGAIAWTGSEGRMPVGTVTDGPTVSLFMPGSPSWDIIMETEHTPYPYTRSGQ